MPYQKRTAMTDHVPQNPSEELQALKREIAALKSLCEHKTTESQNLAKKLQDLEWMFKPRHSAARDFVPEYGDLRELNKDGLIKKTVQKEHLQGIVSEYLDLLETSAAVFEKNGDYALGIFSSGWCQLMDGASRKLCNTADNRKALKSGKWLCHDSCWEDASLKSMNEGRSLEVACNGGINLYAVPIRANQEIIGAINIGFGSPPKDEATLKKLSEKFNIPLSELRKQANEYIDRPGFVTDYAKQRLEKSAAYLGQLIEQRLAEKTLLRTQKTVDKSPLSVFWISPGGKFIYANETAAKKLQYSREDLLAMHVWDVDPHYPRSSRVEQFDLHREHGVRIFESEHRRSDGTLFPVRINAHILTFEGQEIEVAEVEDITEIKQAEAIQVKNEIRLQSQIRIQQYQTESMQDFLNYTLDEAVKLTESEIGYIFFYSEERKEFTHNTWSEGVIQQCSVKDQQNVYQLNNTGIWGEAVRQRKEIIVNDFTVKTSFIKGCPEGHAQLRKFLTVPVFSDNQIVAVVGVANKKSDYNNYDVLQLQLLMDSVWKEVDRKKSLLALEESEELYRRLFETMAQGVVCQSADGTILSANSAAQKMLGLSWDQMQGQTSMDPRWKMITENGEKVPGSQHPVMVALRTGKQVGPVTRGVYIPEKDEYVWLSITATPLFRPGEDKAFQSYAVFDDITLRKQHEDEIQNQRQLLRAILNELPIGIAINTTGPEQRVELINDNFAHIYGVTPKDLPTVESFWEAVYEDETFREKMKNRVLAGISSGDPKRMQWQDIPITRKGKVLKYVSAQNILMEDYGLEISVVTDTTQRKLAENEIIKAKNKAEESRIKFETIFADSPVSILIQDKDTGEIIDANKTAYAAYGFDSLEEMQQSDFWMEPPYSLGDALKHVEKADREGFHVFEWKNRKETGEIFWELVTLRPVVIDGVEYMLATSIDITDQKQKELEKEVLYEIANATLVSGDLKDLLATIKKLLGRLIDTRNFYVGFYDRANDMFSIPFEADEKDQIETWPSANSVTGLVVRKRKSLLLEKTAILELIESGEIEQIGYMCEVWLGVPLFSGSDIIGVLAVQDYHNPNAYNQESKDILEFISFQISMAIQRRQFIEDLVLAKEKAVESDRLKSAFLANMSHEIRTPMNGIMGFAELLKTPDLSPDRQKKYIDIIEKSGVRLLNIINDIVDISRIEAGVMDVSLAESDINEQLDYIYSFFRLQAEDKGIKLLKPDMVPAEKCMVVTDQEKLLAVLTNLVKNALKYSDEGLIEFGCKAKGSFLEFFVKDTGIGIPQDRQQAVFDRFVQADIEDRDARQGAGLGLAISKAYVEMLGGEIWVESVAGKGSVFYFTIPCERKTGQEATIDVSDLSGLQNPQKKMLKTLIVEDDEMSSSLLKSYLEEVAKETLQASTGEEAVEICRKQSDIDLVLMDIKMPVMAGDDAVREIRRFNKDVVIIAQTAKALTGDRAQALASGFDDYITKPISRSGLLECIGRNI